MEQDQLVQLAKPDQLVLLVKRDRLDLLVRLEQRVLQGLLAVDSQRMVVFTIVLHRLQHSQRRTLLFH